MAFVECEVSQSLNRTVLGRRPANYLFSLVLVSEAKAVQSVASARSFTEFQDRRD
jgi:hypothetical protein